MKKYKYRLESLPKKYYWRKGEWFEKMNEEGWELVCLDIPHIGVSGMIIEEYQKYIFRKEIITNILEPSI